MDQQTEVILETDPRPYHWRRRMILRIVNMAMLGVLLAVVTYVVTMGRLGTLLMLWGGFIGPILMARFYFWLRPAVCYVQTSPEWDEMVPYLRKKNLLVQLYPRKIRTWRWER